VQRLAVRPASYFYSRDLAGSGVAEALESAMVGVNTGLITTEVAPLACQGKRFGREGRIRMEDTSRSIRDDAGI